ncbi:Conidial hydrophobin Hyp1 RodA [Aspergillus sclerotialis]|uniref:Hydrophobin n=1 Tax=Aspergillus sclerotialis TaxID=2070753 RepID=A0A3A2ZEY4_9EURO|nr:Conidial hydrophobin Hyp1 RodA [Aspergillus sclerotialis]
MKFSLVSVASVFAFAASVAAAPSGKHFPVPDDMTVKQAQAKCGDQAKLSCCNKANYGDTTNVNPGVLSGLLSNLGGNGGLGLFDGCSELNLNIPVVNLIPVNVQDLVNKRCQQNIACCQNSPSHSDGNLVGVAVPCIALGALI